MIRDTREWTGRGLVIELHASRRTDAASLEADVRQAAGEAVWFSVGSTPSAALHEANRKRDRLLASGTSVVFLCRNGEEARRLRRETPDLTAIIDVNATILTRASVDRATLVRLIRADQTERHGAIDLTGLVPHTQPERPLPMDEVYAPGAGLPADVQGDVPALILAGPGAGKTTTLRWLSYTHAQGRCHAALGRADTAVFLSLASYAGAQRDRTEDLRTFIEAAVGDLLGYDSVDLAPHFPRLALLLDGLDEVSDPAARAAVLDEASALANLGATIVTAGRDHVADDLTSAQAARWQIVRLGELDDAGAVRLVRALVRARHAPDPEALANAIVRHADFDQFSENPLLLTFLVVLASLNRQVPAQRAELYRDLVELLISSWRRIRSSAGGRPIRRAEVLRVVAPLGWHLVARGVGGLPERELVEVLALQDLARGATREAAEPHARQQLALLREDTALLQTSDDLWRFNHPSLAEYFAAQAVSQDLTLLKTLCEHPYNQDLSQVVAFALASALDLEPRDDVARPLLTALSDRGRRRGRYDAKIPRTLALCLVEAPGIPPALRRKFADRVLSVALDRALSPVARAGAMRAVQALTTCGDDAVRAALTERLVQLRRKVAWRRLIWSEDHQPQLTPLWLPNWLNKAALDPGPLLRAWLNDEDPYVRVAAWLPWVRQRPAAPPANRLAELRSRDPAVAEIIERLPARPLNSSLLDRTPYLIINRAGIVEDGG